MHGLFESRQDALCTWRMRKYLVHTELLNEEWCQPIFPVIEVTRNQHRGTLGHHPLDTVGHHFDLPDTAACKQA